MGCSLVAQHAPAKDQLPAKSQLDELKHFLLTAYGYDSLSRVQSRKSCNCGCDIIREKYAGLQKKYFLTADDFCDSYVFTWQAGPTADETLLSTEINAVFSLINEENKKEKAYRKYTEITYETSSDLAYFKIRKYSKGHTAFILSLPYAISGAAPAH